MSTPGLDVPRPPTRVLLVDDDAELAELIALANQLTAVQILGRRLTASVLLIQALGGGWHDSDLPTTADVTRASR
jgi:hypothetical protein